ncbi:MAG: hypothetical protein LUP95_04265 [Euryarchaeota archaeon]|nr:hypothetical protein [Euryarchaeota archaeon]
MRKDFPLILVIVLSVSGMVGLLFAQDVVEFFLLAELTSIATFYVFFSVLIPTLFTKPPQPESVFICGLGKPPYLGEREAYEPPYPLVTSGRIQTEE